MTRRAGVLSGLLGLALLATAAQGAVQGREAGVHPEGEPICPVVSDGEIGPDGVWECFEWTAEEGILDVASPVFVTGPFRLEIVDCQFAGDQFQVRVDGAVVLTSTSVPDGGVPVYDPDACWADPQFSKGSVTLGPGEHAVQVEVIDFAGGFTGGWGVIRGAAVPAQAIPALGGWSLALLAALLASVSFALLRRRRAS
jgi:hypothetical protein